MMIFTPVIPANAGIPLQTSFLRGFAASREAKEKLISRPSNALQALRINLASGQAAKPRRSENKSGIPACAGITV
jgi:hypothetical protein